MPNNLKYNPNNLQKGYGEITFMMKKVKNGQIAKNLKQESHQNEDSANSL